MADRIDLDALEAMEKAATPGPFTARRGPYLPQVRTSAEINGCPDYASYQYPGDAAYDAALRNAAPSMIAELRRLRKIEAAAAEVKRARGPMADPMGSGVEEYDRLDAALLELDTALGETR